MSFSIIILIVFLGILLILPQFQKQANAKYIATASTSDPFRALAGHLGLHYETFTPQSEGNTMYSSGSKMTGTYQGIPVEVVYAMNTDAGSTFSRFAASYTMQKTVAFQVENPNKKEFQILSKSLAPNGGTQTGNSEFDANFTVVGNVNLPIDFIKYCANLGWMNLSLKGNTLLLSDTYYDGLGTTQIMTGIHPIWKSSATNTTIDVQSAKQLFDEMAKLAKTL